MLRSFKIYNLIKVPESDRTVLQLCFNNRGKVYGGYLRDLIAGQKPVDCDMLISRYYFDKFRTECILLGYLVSKKKSKQEHYNFTCPKNTKITLDVCVLDELPEDGLFPTCDLDFEVNALMTDGYHLYRWDTLDNHIEDIKGAILSRKTKIYSQLPERIEKMRRKNYQIVP